MANALVDGMNPPDYIQLDTTNTGSLTNANLTVATVTNAYLGAAACSGTKVSAEYPVCYTGSPYKANCAIQVGTSSLSAGSSVWVNFGTPFAAAPIVVCNSLLTVDSPVCAASGTVATGSFQAIGKTASDYFSWIAIGSGRI